jgi:signal peptidase I
MFKNLYTTRFVVKNGYATQYRLGGHAGTASHNLVRLEGVPDGTYEFYYGQGYEVKWRGITQKLRPSHPLMRYSSELTYKLFNFGISFDTSFAAGPDFRTDRFAYFRDGNLYLLGAPIFKEGEEVLQKFVEEEKTKEGESNFQNPYKAFVDTGPPVKENGELDIEKVKRFGLLIPPKSYLALGDNFAVSGDSREFGFVPQGNLRGGPSFVFWPIGPRLGPPNQPPYPWLTVPNAVIWVLGFICFSLWYVVHRRHHALPLKELE